MSKKSAAMANSDRSLTSLLCELILEISGEEKPLCADLEITQGIRMSTWRFDPRAFLIHR